MNIVGLDEVTLSAPSLKEARRYLTDFGLKEAGTVDGELLFHAKDGTGLRVVARGGTPEDGPGFREALWGVSHTDTLHEIAAELRKDRDVSVDDGLVRSRDDDGNAIAFRVTRRVALLNDRAPINVPGIQPQRGFNEVHDFKADVQPSTFSHLVLHTRDVKRIEQFYAKRLGLRVTDRLTGTGVFLRVGGNADHHQLFFMQREPGRGLHHVAFHVRDLNEMMQAGKAMADKGWCSAWGPGRHVFGGNLFWYFDSPFGGQLEYDADMDVVDDSWVPREIKAGPSTASAWAMSYAASTAH